MSYSMLRNGVGWIVRFVSWWLLKTVDWLVYAFMDVRCQVRRVVIVSVPIGVWLYMAVRRFSGHFHLKYHAE